MTDERLMFGSAVRLKGRTERAIVLSSGRRGYRVWLRGHGVLAVGFHDVELIDTRRNKPEGEQQEADTDVTKASLLETAKQAVADRGLNYGKPEDNFLRIARLWRAHFMNRYAPDGTSSKHLIPAIDAYDVAQMMALMKIARLENDPTHMDSWVDIAGYAACGGEIAGAAKKDA